MPRPHIGAWGTLNPATTATAAGKRHQVWSPGATSDEEDADSPGGGLHVHNQQATQAVLERYLQQLDSSVDSDPMFNRGLERVQQYLSSSTGTACLICLGNIKPSEAVWSCQGSCHAMFHLQCIQDWAKSQIEASVYKAMNRLSEFPGAAEKARAEAEWACPKCRQSYTTKQVPRNYTCFCGKQDDPTFDPWITPHSCGEVCGKLLGRRQEGGEQLEEHEEQQGCQHACLLLCHPGPCPPCPLVVQASCFCGAVSQKKRCGHQSFSCGGRCGARLECGHTCTESCHPGDCPPCQVMGEYKCRCGSTTKRIACYKRDFQCDKVCGKKLGCGNHTCEQICHGGPCGRCPTEVFRTCPCGKHSYTGLGCMEKAKPCGETCDKLLPCGLHTCHDRCHTGPCSTCREVVNKTCRCGKTQKEVQCGAELLCERKCNNMRNCGRHPCKRKCCDGKACPPCEETCNRWLRCGNHKCPAPCHSGPCRPCPLTVTFGCACGKMQTTIPCGAEATVAAPRCYGTCPVPYMCRHAADRKPHRCHFGPCPPCRFPCGTSLTCGHVCGSAKCHDPSPPAIASFKPPAAPKSVQLTAASVMNHLGNAFGALPDGSSSNSNNAGSAGSGGSRNGAKLGSDRADDVMPPSGIAAVAALKVLESRTQGELPSSCAPCSTLIPVTCIGKHTTKQVECRTAAPFACDKPCGALLACGNHMCRLRCHARASDSDNAQSEISATPCEQCTQACGKVRPCGHPCEQACHTGSCPACTAQVRTPCHCGKASLKLSCPAFQTASAAPVNKAGTKRTGTSDDPLCCGKPCHKQLPNCPHPCRAVCHVGTCPGVSACEEEVTVKCSCKRLKAKWKCHQVQAALKASGKPSAYDDMTPLRLLPCDKDCVKVDTQTATTKSKTAAPDVTDRKGRSTSGKEIPHADHGDDGTGGEDHGVAGASGKKQKLSKAEREAEATRRYEERLKKEKAAKTRKMIMWMLLVVIGLLLGVVAPLVLQKADKKAQNTWKPGRV